MPATDDASTGWRRRRPASRAPAGWSSSRATWPTPPTARPRRRRAGRPGPAGAQRQHARPGAAAAAARDLARGPAGRLGDQRGGAGGAHRAAPPPAAGGAAACSWASPPTPPPSTTRPGAPTPPPRPRWSTRCSRSAPRSRCSAYAVDPGDLRTEMHQAAFPGEDISDRPLPESVVPAFRRLLWHRPSSGRHRLADWAEPTSPATTPRGPAHEDLERAPHDGLHRTC